MKKELKMVKGGKAYRCANRSIKRNQLSDPFGINFGHFFKLWDTFLNHLECIDSLIVFEKFKKVMSLSPFDKIFKI